MEINNHIRLSLGEVFENLSKYLRYLSFLHKSK